MKNLFQAYMINYEMREGSSMEINEYYKHNKQCMSTQKSTELN